VTAEKLSAISALSAVMAEVQSISKSQRVTSGPAQFNFRGVDAVVNVVGPILRKHGVVVVPHSVEEIREERYETASKKPMHGVILRIVWRFYGPDGSFIEASSVGESADSGDKASPKAHSVAYRTVLLQALCIPTDDPDPDSQVHERGATAQAAAELTISEWAEQIQNITAPEDLQRLGSDLAKSGLSPAAKAPLKEKWSARMRELAPA